MKKNLKYLEKRKKEIDSKIIDLIQQQKKTYSVHSASKPTFDYLEKFLISGKTVRGGIFLEFANQLKKFTSSERKKLISLATAIEIIHSALLIQDDYMDKDSKRRGMTAFFNQRLDLATQQKIDDPDHYAVSSLICATDICFFIAFQEIATNAGLKNAKIIDFISQEYSHLGFSQWKEVLMSKKNDDFSFDEIETIYKYKTARYTFTIPIVMAGIIAEVDKKTLSILDKASENIGMVFQITDDYLSLFGDSKVTGKNLGNDVIENKKTFYLYFLNEELKKDENKKFRYVKDYYGKKDLTSEEINKLQSALIDLKITQKIDEIIKTYQNEFINLLGQCKISPQSKRVLIDVFEYLKSRQK